MFNKLHINIPFTNVLALMKSYLKHKKDILPYKRKLQEFEIIVPTRKCNAILQKKLLAKLKNPRSFYISYTTERCNFYKALCDPIASVNIMPLSVNKKLQLEDVKLTIVFLLLA